MKGKRGRVNGGKRERGEVKGGEWVRVKGGGKGEGLVVGKGERG